MAMSTRATSPEEYVELLRDWPRDCAQFLREHVKSAAEVQETIKWGHLVYLSNGPVLFIRAEKERVLFGFWRGKRLLEIAPELKPGGKYEMATIEIQGEPYPSSVVIRDLVVKAVKLNAKLGNPQDDAKKS